VSARLLVVAEAPGSEEELRRRIRLDAGEAADVVVVAPASDVSLLEWLASDEDRARAAAERRAREVAGAVPAYARVEEARVGDVDPVLAIEDALRTFPADEVIVVTPPEDAARWLELDLLHALQDRVGVPVKYLVADGVPAAERGKVPRGRVGEFLRTIARGENPFTGFLAELGVGLVVGTVALVLIAIALILWLSLR
jgi:hypothetical protein